MKKILALTIAIVLMVGVCGGAAFAAPLTIMPVGGAEAMGVIGSIDGTVIDISDLTQWAEPEKVIGKRYTLETENGAMFILLIQEDTYFLVGGDMNAVQVGDKVIGYFDASLPAITIYPPQQKAVAIAVNLKAPPAIKVDAFDENLLSADGSLKINIGDMTEIIDTAGNPYTDDLGGMRLAVFYTLVMNSYPSQTTPEKIVVLSGNEVDADVDVDLSAIETIVSGKKIDAPAPFFNEEGILMVPLRAIAEALDYRVLWDAPSRKVMLGNTITVAVEENSYVIGRRAPMELVCSPVLQEGITYVPIQFFREVVQMNNAYLFEGQLIINNEEAVL